MEIALYKVKFIIIIIIIIIDNVLNNYSVEVFLNVYL